MAISNNSTGLRPGVCTSTTRPTAPYEGQTIYETDTDMVAIWNGVAWRTVIFAGQYKVGDTGPAGGTIIFVDYLNQFSTFNYIEISPVSTEVSRQWCVTANQETSVGTTKLGIGEGQANTALIIAQSGNNDSATVAAAYCDSLSSGGYSDWYLPSLAELQAWQNTMITTDTGGLNPNYTYWSSSEKLEWFAYGISGIEPDISTYTTSKYDQDSGDPNFNYVRAVRKF
jgi:hypothetical protein